MISDYGKIRTPVFII